MSLHRFDSASRHIIGIVGHSASVSEVGGVEVYDLILWICGDSMAFCFALALSYGTFRTSGNPGVTMCAIPVMQGILSAPHRRRKAILRFYGLRHRGTEGQRETGDNRREQYFFAFLSLALCVPLHLCVETFVWVSGTSGLSG